MLQVAGMIHRDIEIERERQREWKQKDMQDIIDSEKADEGIDEEVTKARVVKMIVKRNLNITPQVVRINDSNIFEETKRKMSAEDLEVIYNEQRNPGENR